MNHGIEKTVTNNGLAKYWFKAKSEIFYRYLRFI